MSGACFIHTPFSALLYVRCTHFVCVQFRDGSSAICTVAVCRGDQLYYISVSQKTLINREACLALSLEWLSLAQVLTFWLQL